MIFRDDIAKHFNTAINDIMAGIEKLKGGNSPKVMVYRLIGRR